MQAQHPTYRAADEALRADGYRYDLICRVWRDARGLTATIHRAQASSAEPPAYVVTYCAATDAAAARRTASSSSRDAQP